MHNNRKYFQQEISYKKNSISVFGQFDPLVPLRFLTFLYMLKLRV